MQRNRIMVIMAIATACCSIDMVRAEDADLSDPAKPIVIAPGHHDDHQHTEDRFGHDEHEVFYTNALASMGLDTTDDGIVALLDHEKMTVRKYACIVAGQRKLEDARPKLFELLGDPAPAVRVEAARSLGRFGDRAGVDALKEIVNEGFLELPLIAAGVLAELDDPSGYPLLVRTLKDDERQPYRFRAMTELTKFVPLKGEKVDGMTVDPVPLLFETLRNDEDEFVRTNTAYALGRTLNQEYIPQLQAERANATEKVRNAIDVAIGLIRLRTEPGLAEKVTEGQEG